ncbi:MAG: Asp-tRNA(Asn)/Glu-tRNA(Gln) amidotransferase subunit GatC [Candidatus Dadabacteria bacterium]|nr:MAG: Asp-tRNA(Asn)/Glu-tRNA(Gln) amidotransferase subunit GatC [Candidatus Dadabacteria bacterium]
MKEQITKEQLVKVAYLARLKLSEEEALQLKDDLNKVLNYVEQLNELNVEEVEPVSHVFEIETPFREDEAVYIENTEKYLENIPDRSGRYIRVPLIVDYEE